MTILLAVGFMGSGCAVGAVPTGGLPEHVTSDAEVHAATASRLEAQETRLGTVEHDVSALRERVMLAFPEAAAEAGVLPPDEDTGELAP
jgi:hypothetical protein